MGCGSSRWSSGHLADHRPRPSAWPSRSPMPAEGTSRPRCRTRSTANNDRGPHQDQQAEPAGRRQACRDRRSTPRNAQGRRRSASATSFWLMAEAERPRAQSHYLIVDDAAASRTPSRQNGGSRRSAMDAMDADKIPTTSSRCRTPLRYRPLRGLIVQGKSTTTWSAPADHDR